MYSQLESVERRYGRALTGLYLHATIYTVVSIALYVVSATMNSTTLLIWIATAWGIGFAGHAIAVLAATPEDYQQMFAHRYRRAVRQSRMLADTVTWRDAYVP